MPTRLPALYLCALMALPALANEDASPDYSRDLEVLRETYVLRSAAFSPAAREDALGRIERARGRAAVYTPPAFAAELMAIAALAENGHDYFEPGTGWFPDQRLPLRLAWLADGLVVARSPAGYRRLLGARVLAMDDAAPEAVMAALRRHDGALPAYLRGNKGWVIESAAMLHAFGVAERPDRVKLTLQRTDGVTEILELADTPVAAQALDQGRIGLLAGDATAQEQTMGWDNATAGASTPLYLQEPGRLLRRVDLPALDALYIQLRGNYDAGGQSLVEFAEQTRQSLQASSRRHVILDQRFNHGGNSDLTLELTRDIGSHTRGRVYVITGGQTFSAGIVSAALVKQAAGGNARLVGEPVGDRLRWWSEGSNACLPESGHCLHVSTGLWDLVRGCAGEPGCYGDRFGIRIDHLEPDLVAPLTVAAWLAGRDPAMEAIAADLAALTR